MYDGTGPEDRDRSHRRKHHCDHHRGPSYYLSHKDVAGMFGTGGGDTYACGLVSAKYGLAKNGVIVAGFDMFPQTLGYIHTGDMTFTTDQQPYLQGFCLSCKCTCTSFRAAPWPRQIRIPP